MKIALVYDRVNKFGGAERLLLALHKIWPEAPLFTAVYDEKRAAWAKVFQIRSSFLQSWPIPKAKHELYPFLTVLAFEAFSFADFDVVLSVTSAEAKGIITRPETLHISYHLTPTRYLWTAQRQYRDQFFGRSIKLFAPFIFPLQSLMRIWDNLAATRVDRYLAISQTVANRITKYYRRKADVIYPPVDTKFFHPSVNRPIGNYFLTVGRLVPYKRFDIVVAVFNKLGWPLKIVGSGSHETYLKSRARSNIEFLGNLTDRELLSYYQDCRAMVFAGDEDFGLVSLETQACGRPVVVFGKGGMAETVVDGVTGIFFYPQTGQALYASLQHFIKQDFSPYACRKNALQFAQPDFARKMKKIVTQTYQLHQKNLI